MPSRSFPPSPELAKPSSFTRTKVLFLVLTISSSLVIVFTILYLLYHFYYSIVNRTRTIPFDSSAPLKIERFSYKELKSATLDFNEANVIGKGGSGTVFKGVLRDGKLVAVKRLDSMSLETEREFQNELQILGGLRSPFLVTLLGYCVEKNKRILVYEYMPNRSLQELLFGEGGSSLDWEKRFAIILDVARALEFLHLGCDPPVIHGDVKPSNVLLDSDFRAKVSDFGLSRMKIEGEYGLDFLSQDFGKSQELWKSQELSGTLTTETPVISTPVEQAESVPEVDFALALQASSSSKNSKTCFSMKALNLSPANFDAVIGTESDVKGGNGKGKEVSAVDIGYEEWKNKFVPYDDGFSISLPRSDVNPSGTIAAANDGPGSKQWGKDWWWRQDGSGELCSKDYVMEWIGSQICPSTNPDWEDEGKSIPEGTNLNNLISAPLDKLEGANEAGAHDAGAQLAGKELEKDSANGEHHCEKRHRKMQDWWKEEHVADTRRKQTRLKKVEMKWKQGFNKLPHFDLGRRFYFRSRKKFSGEQSQHDSDGNGEFSFRRGLRKKNGKSNGSDMWSGDLFSRELSSTTSMRGTLCYVAPEYGGCGYLMEKADVYSLGVLILVIVSGRRPLHVLASPMKLEKANLVSWCRHLAQAGDILELVDERLKSEYNKDQASLCINLGLTCLQKMPELRPDIGEIVKILKGEMDLPPLPYEFSPSPPGKMFSRSRRKPKFNAE